MDLQLHQLWSFQTLTLTMELHRHSILCTAPSSVHSSAVRRRGYGVRKGYGQLRKASNSNNSSAFTQPGNQEISGMSLSPWTNEAKEEEIEANMRMKVSIGNEGEDPYRVLESGKKVYLDELDVLTLLDPPAYPIPNDANTYDQAAYLWKRIGDIPEERRHRLIDLLTSNQVQAMWEIAGDGSGMSKSDPGSIFLGSRSESFMNPVTWNGRTFSDSWILNLFSAFQKTFFLSTDESVYGRVIVGGWLLKVVPTRAMPLYFEVRETQKVVPTEEACNISFEYGDGQLHLQELPLGFPKPVQHPWPFNDGAYDYLRIVGPGVVVGQWWIEGKDLDTIPKKVFNFVMVQEYGSI